MPTDTPAPISHCDDCFGQSVPIYGLTFDKKGTCTSPLTRDHVMAEIAAGGFTDVIIYSHGWNNDFPTAKERYETFLRGISDTNAAHPGQIGAGFKPMMVGIFWPSTILLWPSEQTPDIAATGDEEVDFSEALELLDPDMRAKVEARLADGDTLGRDEARAIATQIAAQLPPPDAGEADPTPYAPEDLVDAWENLGKSPQTSATSGSSTSFGTGDDAPATGSDAEVAGLFGFDPRVILRATTVLKMKDRAGVVGSNGVAETLGRVLDETAARVHLVGHSYGCKVVSAALTRADAPRVAESVLLLQPAINHLAFAPDARGGVPGGYRPALTRSAKPIMASYSWRDVPLYRVFHIVARRKSDIGELQAAAGVGRYNALGGVGPQEYAPGEVLALRLPNAGDPYPTPAASVRLIGLDGAIGITGHADVNNAYTYWAMLQQLA